jgi:hypothetical protein
MNGNRHGVGFGMGSALLGVLAVAGTLGCSGTMAQRGRAPSVAFGAPAADVDQGCSLDGMPRVVATKVRPMVGITALADGGVVWLRFATTRDARVAVAIDPDTLQVVDAGEPPAEAAAASVEGPVEVDLPGAERLVAWTEGSSEESRVKAITVAPQGVAVGKAIDLGFEGSAIGRPAAAFGAHGKGVLAFIESNEVGFQVVVVRTACATGG